MLRRSSGFTIVELLIVIVVIAILAALSYVGYASVSSRAAEATVQSDVTNASKKLRTIGVDTGSYPSALPSEIKASGDNTIHYTQTGSGTGYCLTVTSSKSNVKAYYASETQSTTQGNCPGHPSGGGGGGGGAIADGAIIQTITAANCPTTRTRAVDARDNRTYWVQKMDDGKCWMLTNLAYAGGGTNIYSDIIPTTTLTNGTSDTSATYTAAKYYVPTGANPTTEPTNPSASTDGTGQYGYLYNFCGANGGQTGNGACSSSSDAAVDTSVSVCPAGWRLPNGGTGGELGQMTTAIGATNNSAGATILQQVWLAQRGGYWYSGFGSQGSGGSYWSSSQSPATSGFRLYFDSSNVYPSSTVNKVSGFSVRCVAV